MVSNGHGKIKEKKYCFVCEEFKLLNIHHCFIVKLRVRVRVRVKVKLKVKSQKSKLDPEVGSLIGWPTHPPTRQLFLGR